MTSLSPCPDDPASCCTWKSRKKGLVRIEEDETQPSMTNPPRSSLPAPNGRLSNIISKIASPFSSKPRTWSDFYITTAENDPRPRYSPGDDVKGWINLVIQRPTRVTHISVSLHGFAKVYKHSAAPGEGNPIDMAPTRGSSGAFGTGSQVIWESENMVCGDGKLSPGKYRFGFNFRLPSGPLPSSIDFERGTISYVITAILTRPTTISPTVACEKKIEILEIIDIADPVLSKPAKQSFKLRPVTKSKKSKANKALQAESKVPASVAASQTTQTTRPSSSNADLPEDPPKSPSISEFSTQSGLTGSSNSAALQAVTIDTGDGSQGRNSIGQANLDDKKTIEIRVDLLKRGYLPGDEIHVKIAVKHHKHIQNMRGVIVTLYRRARVDSRTDRTLTKTKSKTEYVPKSRTAYGGLTFATPRPDHTFRMDLAQAFAPMVTHPDTFIAEVKPVVRIPEEVFPPSITCVPEEMIHFSYHLEVIMDVNGKLASLDRFMPWMSMTKDPSNPTIGQAAQPSYTASGHMNQFFDTSAIRRRDTIPDCLFDITIGTKDSLRKKPKRRPDPWDPPVLNTQNPSREPSPPEDIKTLEPVHPPPTPPPFEPPRAPGIDIVPAVPHPEPMKPLTEKGRLATLLPSQPAYSSGIEFHATAPEEDDLEHGGIEAPAYDGPPTSTPNFVNGSIVDYYTEIGQSSSNPSAPPALGPVDDKQELERQRLIAGASAPEYGNGDDDHPTQNPPAVAPSAPLLDEDDDNDWAPPVQSTSTTQNQNVTRVRLASAPQDLEETHDAFGEHLGESELPTYQR